MLEKIIEIKARMVAEKVAMRREIEATGRAARSIYDEELLEGKIEEWMQKLLKDGVLEL